MRKAMKRNPILSQGWRDCFLGHHNVVHSATMHRFSLSLSLHRSFFLASSFPPYLRVRRRVKFERAGTRVKRRRSVSIFVYGEGNVVASLSKAKVRTECMKGRKRTNKKNRRASLFACLASCEPHRAYKSVNRVFAVIAAVESK